MDGLVELISHIPFLPTRINNTSELPGWEILPPDDSQLRRLYGGIYISYSLVSVGYTFLQYRWIVLNGAFGLSKISSSLASTVIITQGLGLLLLSVPLMTLLNHSKPSIKSLLLKAEHQKVVRHSIAKALSEYLNEDYPSPVASFWLVRDEKALRKFLDSNQNKLKQNIRRQSLLAYVFNQRMGIFYPMKILRIFIEKQVKLTREEFFYIRQWLESDLVDKNNALEKIEFPRLNPKLYPEKEQYDLWKEACFSKIMTEWFLWSEFDVNTKGSGESTVLEFLMREFEYVDPAVFISSAYKEAMNRLVVSGAELPLSLSQTELYRELEGIQNQVTYTLKSAARDKK